MRWRILAASIVVSLVAVIALAVPLSVRLANDDRTQAIARLQREAMVHEIQKKITDHVMHVPIYELAFIWGVGPRVEESGAGRIPGFSYSAPFEDLKVKK